ncbi:MAG: nucleoside triphosphate pyrophosphatase [Arenicellales bacterium]|mgnify:FL=1|nr:nucleoside triphosphate pyrophosphatase [Arenicellales bacterium]
MSKNSKHQELVLASSSRYRRALLDMLLIPFRTVPPDIDESRKHDEDATTLVERLASEKAQVVGQHEASALIIGSDQVAVYAGQIVGKPIDREDAISQLELVSGGKAELLTSVAVLNTLTRQTQAQTVSTLIQFKSLSRPGIEFYLDTDKPYDCCGSVRVEGLGITLLKSIHSSDPTAVMGLPMIALVSMLEKEGIDPLMVKSPTRKSVFEPPN